MKAIFFKELDESGKWALLIMLLYCWPIGWTVLGDWPIVRVQPEFFGVATFGLAGIGVLLAMIQIAYDWQQGRFAFLMHRPISRRRIFAAKVMAGIVLYALAGGVPLAATVVFDAIPWGVHWPFDIHLVYQGIALWLNGLIWYFAAIVVATRDARWSATRILPFGGGLAASCCIIFYTLNFVEVFALLALAIPLSAIAAGASFVAAGSYARQGPGARFLNGTMIACSCAMLVFIAGACLGNAVFYLVRPASTPEPWTQYSVDRDGTILKEIYDHGSLVSLTDLEGKPTTQPVEGIRGRRYAYPLYITLGSPEPNFRGSARLWSMDRYVHQIYGTNWETWFYVSGTRTILGINDKTGRSAGSLGPSGYKPPGEAAEAFSAQIDASQYPLIRDDTHVYLADPYKRTMNELLQLPPGQNLRGAIFDENENRTTTGVALATDSELYLVRPGGDLIFKTPLALPGVIWHGTTITPTRQGTYMLHYDQISKQFPPPQEVLELSATGQVLRKVELPAPQLPTYPKISLFDSIWGIFAPPVWSLHRLFIWYSWAKIWPGTSWSGARLSSGWSWPGMWLYPVTTLITALASVVLTLLLRRQFRLDRKGTTVWSIAAFLLGISGILTLLAVRGLPLRVKCPRCGRARSIHRTDCEHCGQPFAGPPQKGIEIFE
jgi:hypothetical protein